VAKVKIFSSSCCTSCKGVKQFLLDKGIEFEDVDVFTDPKAMDEMIRISGAVTTPVIVIGKEVIVGWDQSKVEKALQL
jgi:glutaredoxin